MRDVCYIQNVTYVTKLKMPLEKKSVGNFWFFLRSRTHNHTLPFNPRYGYFFVWISFRTKITTVFSRRMLRFSDMYDYFHIYMENSGSYEQWVFFYEFVYYNTKLIYIENYLFSTFCINIINMYVCDSFSHFLGFPYALSLRPLF